MSRIYFHSPSGTAELHGSERAWLRHVAEGPARAAWDLERSGSHQLERAAAILSLVHDVPGYLAERLALAKAEDARLVSAVAAKRYGTYDPEPLRQLVLTLDTCLRVRGLELDVAGARLSTSNVELNTALAAGSDVVRLAAKIHGWCEDHCWVEGPDRVWMAAIIDEGLRTGIYRRGLWYTDGPDAPRDKWSDQGWGNVAELLRSHDDEPVVLSYSVCDQFPNREVAGWEPVIDPAWIPDWATNADGRAEWDALDEEAQHSYRREHALDVWYELPAEERWLLAMEGLREDRPWARLAPDTLAEVTFSYPVTVYDLFAPDRDERVRAACGLVAAS